MRSFLYISFVFMLSLTSCGPNVIYKESHIINDSWSYENNIDFNFEIDDPKKEYDLLLSVTHDTNFGYQNIYTKITTTYPTNEEFTSPLSIELANKMGSWLSTCSGEECTLHLLLRDDVKFKDVGNYRISFTQDTREANLVGIQALSLSLIETEN